jgi:antitoxin MazE
MEATMQVFKWGDDLAVQLSETLVEEMGLKAGDELEIVDVVERTLLVHKQDRREAAYKLDRDEASER